MIYILYINKFNQSVKVLNIEFINTKICMCESISFLEQVQDSFLCHKSWNNFKPSIISKTIINSHAEQLSIKRMSQYRDFILIKLKSRVPLFPALHIFHLSIKFKVQYLKNTLFFIFFFIEKMKYFRENEMQWPT